MTKNRRDLNGRDSVWPERTYEVGYGKPPKQTRFAKGQSGNPLGRPRKLKPQPIRLSDAPSDAFLETEAYHLITLRENGQEIQLPAMQAVLRAMTTGAIKGNRLAQEYLIEYLARVEEASFRAKVERYNRLKALKREGEEILAKYKGKNTPPPEFFPHPDDIVLNPVTGDAWVNGPLNQDEAHHYDQTVALRDHLMMRAANMESTLEHATGSNSDRPINAYMVFAQLLNNVLPIRYRWKDGDDLLLLMRSIDLPSKDRERRIAEDYKNLLANEPKMSMLSPAQKMQVHQLADRWFERKRLRA